MVCINTIIFLTLFFSFARFQRPEGFVNEDIDFLKPFVLTCANILISRRNLQQRKIAEIALQESNAEMERKIVIRTRELIAAKEQAELAVREKNQLIANLSHDLRTPLHCIMYGHFLKKLFLTLIIFFQNFFLFQLVVFKTC